MCLCVCVGGEGAILQKFTPVQGNTVKITNTCSSNPNETISVCNMEINRLTPPVGAQSCVHVKYVYINQYITSCKILLTSNNNLTEKWVWDKCYIIQKEDNVFSRNVLLYPFMFHFLSAF